MTIPADQHLLPPNATPAEQALSAGLNREPVLGPPADAIAGWRFERPLPAGFGPYLVDEYRLGTIRSFFASDEACIDSGVPWQRLRGTLAAVETALVWNGYANATVEPPVTGRAKWHRYQIAMGELPLPAEDPRLYQAEYLASLSDPARSLFWRGWHGYDVRALQWSGKRWSEAIWSDDSGVRMPDGSTKWSHGRDHGPFEVTAGSALLPALGLDTLAVGALTWATQLTWAQVGHLTWADPTAAQRAELLARVLIPVTKHIAFFDAGGMLIGARRCIDAVRATTFGGVAVPANQTVLTCRARTGFGDGVRVIDDGSGPVAQPQTAATAALIIGATSARGDGDLWVAPDDLTPPDGVTLADLTIGPVVLPINFTLTIREHVTITARLL